MHVKRKALTGQLSKLVVDDPSGLDYHEGEVVGYRCDDCGQADETLGQIWHDETCSLAGEHGRKQYDTLQPIAADGGHRSPELQPEHPITAVKAGETDTPAGVQRGAIVLFACDRCGNADEALFEIVHDENCPLAGRHGRRRNPA